MKKKQKIALFPGCFDPFHNQHHNIIKNLLKDTYLNLDQIWILVNSSSQEKKLIGSFAERWKIIDQLWKNSSKVYLYPKSIPFYTTVLIKQLQKKYPDWQFYLVLGTDQVNQLLNWKNLANLQDLLTIIAIERKEFPLVKALTQTFHIYQLPMDVINNISSTEIKTGKNWKTALNSLTYFTLQKKSSYLDFVLQRKKLKKALNANILSAQRKQHCQNTANLAQKLAIRFNYPQWANQLYDAGLLHDIAKEWKDDFIFAFYQKEKIPLAELKKLPRAVWHAQVGAYYCAKRLNITEQKILVAIKYHTTASKKMDDFSKILFLADKLEIAKKEAIFSKAKTNLFNPELSLSILFKWTLKAAYQKILAKGLCPTIDSLEAYSHYCHNDNN